MKGCTVSGEVIAVYGGWSTEPVYGATGGIVRVATEGGTGRDAAEENTVPAGVVAGYVGWVTGPVYVATERSVQKGVQYAARPKGIQYAARLEGVQYSVGSSRGTWGGSQEPSTVLQERRVQLGVQYAARPLGGGGSGY